MHAIQTSGNCIRNTTTDHFAGIAPDELVNPLVWCEIIRQWSTLHPEFAFLPRKFKIAVSGAEDRAAVGVHDIGLQAVERDGKLGFRVWIGGGMGRTPIVGKLINPFVEWQDLLTYLQRCASTTCMAAVTTIQGAHQDPGQGPDARGVRATGRRGMADHQGRPGHHQPGLRRPDRRPLRLAAI